MSQRALSSNQFKNHLGTIALGASALGIAAGFAGNAVLNDVLEEHHQQWGTHGEDFERPHLDLRGE